jgi:hypothetical protein
MSFSTREQGIYRPLVTGAWETHCAAEGIDPKDKIAKDAWYRAQLHECLGVWTTKQCNPTAHFRKACAHFEAIIGKSIFWQMQVAGGDIRTARHGLQTLAEEHDIDSAYIAGIAHQMFDTTPENLNAPRLRKLIAALKIHFHRHDPSEPQLAATRTEPNPF